MTPGEGEQPTAIRTESQIEIDRRTVEALRRGDEAAFQSLVSQYHPLMVRVALIYLPDLSTAEDVAQEAWMGVLQGIDRFEGRSSLKTWIFRILTNRAKTRRDRESRSIPFSDLEGMEDPEDEPAELPARFRPLDAPQYPGGWADPPRPWEAAPEDRVLQKEILQCMGRALETLPASQRSVILMRDVQGWSSEEVCNILELSETNQRVLLHRARSKVRRALEAYFETERES